MSATPPGSTPDLPSVRRALGFRGVGLDLENALERWRAAGHDGDERAFVAWILAELESDAVMVTEVLPPRLAAARAQPALEATIVGVPGPVVPAAAEQDATFVEAPDAPPDATVVMSGPPAGGEGAGEAALDPARARYLILGEAGRGGMAVVHIARDLELMRKVALKRLAGSISAHAEVHARFLREVQISAQLDHPNIVPVYGLEVGPDGLPAYAMKLVEGRTLDAFLKEARDIHERGEALPDTHTLAARLEHFLKVSDAMAYAHGKGVIHRDLKPANVMIGRYNEIYVMDWGICRVLQLPEREEALAGLEDADADIDSRTRIGAVVGTARYMAPEQATGATDKIGPASDQYSLGLILFEIATLQGAYAGKTMVDVLGQAARAELKPIEHAYGQPIPGELQAIITKATSLDPAERYENVRALADDVRRFLRGEAVDARPDTSWQKAARRLARHRQAALLALVSLVAIAALGSAALLYRHDRALEAAAVRERAILALVDDVSRHGDVLQARFLELQGELDALATAASIALQHTSPAAGAAAAVRWAEDFKDPARQPPGMVRVVGFDEPVSFDVPAWRLAPGIQRGQVLPAIGRLQHAQPYQRDLFARARVLFGNDDGEAGVAHGSGVHAFVVGLAAGATLHLPGRGGVPDVHPREASWYRLADRHAGAVWGEPGMNQASQRLVVPLAQAFRDTAGNVLGVTAMLLELDTVIQNLLRDAADVGVRATLLLDAEGRVIASSGLLHPQFAEDGSDVVTLQAFPDEALIQAVAVSDAGFVESRVFGVDDLLVFDKVLPMGWVLVKVTEEPD